jgi:N-acetylmuramic acid 6-phosphate etherase
MVLNTHHDGRDGAHGQGLRNLMVDLQFTCQKLQDRGERILMETTGMQREQAAELLERAGGHVKTALVMHGRGVDRDEARRLLDEAGGVIARVVEGLGA